MQGNPRDLMAPLGVRGAISFCECQLMKDKKRLTVRKAKVKGMDSVSSGCDCCYLCFKGVLRAEEGDVNVDQMSCSSCP